MTRSGPGTSCCSASHRPRTSVPATPSARSHARWWRVSTTASRAEEAFDRVFREGGIPDDVPEVEWSAPDGTVHLPALIAEAFGVSTSEARRSLAQGGVRLDGEPVSNGSLDVEAGAVDGKVLRLGRRRFARVKVR
jgi:tyrosyl-tRNA synthetase